MNWLKGLQAQVRFNEPLSAHTTLGIGGPAKVWVKPQNLKALKKIICHCVKEKMPYFVIGKGSNILFSDQGLKGVVISLDSSAFSKMELAGRQISCGGGLSLHKLINYAKKRGLGGVEFLSGIPASVGGALVMNAGNHNNSIGNLVKNATVMDRKGRVQLLTKKQLRFGYRRSNLARYLVLETVLKLTPQSPKIIQENIAANLSQKSRSQDLTAKSAGCVFKNPRHHLSAGQMIEACGLKSATRGGAGISAKHANFIINRCRAKARDVLYLMNLAQRKVKKKFGVGLVPEIKIIGSGCLKVDRGINEA